MRPASVIPLILEDEFGAFVALAVKDARFPKTYEAWIEQVKENDAEKTVDAPLLPLIEVHPEEFAHWCWKCSQTPTFGTVFQFASSKARRSL